MVSRGQNPGVLPDNAFGNTHPVISSGDRLGSVGRAIVMTMLADYSGSIAVRLWDDSLAFGTNEATCTIVFREPAALRDLVLHHDLLRIAECYMAGTIDVYGDLESLFDLKPYLAVQDLSLADRLRLVRLALRLPRLPRHYPALDWCAKSAPRRNSLASIAHHYDVSNDFYRLWLDPEMVYSCAYFSNAGQSLADAQRDKLDYLCRKLRLAPGHMLLDIGCGWGALALWAARHYGVRVHGITLSREQQRYARARVLAAGMENRIRIELLDYRDLPKDVQYDRIVSVGMFEHVGVENYPDYFSTVQIALKPRGLFLNHGITDATGWRDTPLTRFMNTYIFPDGELARISDVTAAMETSGFDILDVENLCRHYVLTLREWLKALISEREAAIRHTSEATYRLWRLYMAGCAWHFDEGGIGVHQVLAGRRHDRLPLPLRRDDLYNSNTCREERK